MNNVIAFIFARGGSKGLPGKNTRNFLGKPLIAWSIEQAGFLDRISRVIVSTDSEEIAETALHFGAEVPFLRPSSLATDESPEWLSWQHAVNFLYASGENSPYIFLSLPATAPLRNKSDVELIIDKYEQGNFDSIITVTESYRNPYFNMVKYDEHENLSVVIKSSPPFHRRQDAPCVYDMTTVAYATSPAFISSHNSIFEGRVGSIEVPKHRAADIDTLYDFHLAEAMAKLNQEV